MFNRNYIVLISRGLLLTYFIILVYWMFLGFSRSQADEYSYNLIPFSTIKNYFQYFSHYPLLTWSINIIGNVTVFVPFGILIPLSSKRNMKLVTFIFVFLLGITTLEIMQFITRVGSFDVDDIILNTTGALIGFILLKGFYKGK
ncbi:VanZ family protein [Litchfieldia salsa]|uniref:VanZ like family protein n=1 Tax=Litchfieldia salsa TaxID=930152 RepID=A0A1H0WXC7_9BACI|nr:VanZ family protein [Litchfieldia salsa]SDP95363.1 VanZ like family protein [Litchfieldia salsa]